MLPRAKRLSRADWGAAAQGKRAISAHFSVTVSPAPAAKAAAVVSKKVAKKSVDRHLLKRRILAAIEPHLRPGRAYIIYARAGSPKLPYWALSEELAELLTKRTSV